MHSAQELCNTRTVLFSPRNTVRVERNVKPFVPRRGRQVDLHGKAKLRREGRAEHREGLFALDGLQQPKHQPVRTHQQGAWTVNGSELAP